MTELRHDGLNEHVAACEECRAAAPPLARIAALLDAEVPPVQSGRLSELAIARVAPVLASHANAAFWRRVMRVLGLSLLPLPVVVLADTVLLAWIYRAAAALLPSGLVAYFLFSYAAAVVVGIGLAYAAIPLLLAHRPVPQHAGSR